MVATFHLRFLGPVQVERDGVLVRGFRSRKALALLGYLAVQGQPIPREYLVDLFWEDKPEAQGRANLSWVLHRITTMLPGCLQADRHTVQFHRTALYWLDMDAFQVLEEQGDAASLATAVELYRGEFLEGLSLDGCAEFEIWLVGEREQWRQRVTWALGKLVTRQCQCGEYEQAVRFARRLLTLEPWREETHQQMMWLLAWSGQRSAALAQYETCCKLLAEELGVEPSKETREIYDLLLKEEPLPDLSAPFKPARKPRVVGACPYRGLSAFREEDAPFFFGREDFAERLTRTVRERAKVAVIVGSSGSGKSSAVFAGLLPRLREEGDWLIVNSRPGAQPFQAQAAALLPLLEPDLSETDQLVEIGRLAKALSAGDISFLDVAERVLRKTFQASCLLLVVDQFEELYTLCPEPEVRRRFLDGLLAAVEAVPAFTLVLALRADFMGQALTHRPFADALQESALILGPMTREELRAAIERPAEKQGAAFEAGLVERVLDDVGKEPGNLPLLEFALALLWERHEHGWLTHATYEEIGGVSGALTRYADQVYEEMDADERTQARYVFGQLVRPGEGTIDTRRVATRAELGEENWPMAQRLADRRLVVTGRDATTGDEIVEVVHEALIQSWGQLRAWMNVDRAFRTWQERLRAALHQWKATGQDNGMLLRGTPLAEAEGWFEERRDELSTEETFIQASVALREKRQAERERWRWRTIRALSGGLVVALILALLTFQQWQRAKDEEWKALLQASIGLASQAMFELEGSFPERSVLLALEALENYPYTWQAERALGQAILDGRLRQILPHGGIVNTAEWSADGARILTGSADGSVSLWDAVTGEELLKITEGAPALASWSPDEGSILTVNGEGTTLTVWDAESDQERFTLDEDDLGGKLHINLEPWEPWSPSGDRFLTYNADGRMTIWDAETASALRSIPIHPATQDQAVDAPSDDLDNLLHLFLGEQGTQALWSPGGDLIVTSSNADSTVTVWDANTGEELYTLAGGFEDQSVLVAGWSPSGEHFATRGLGGVKVYETGTGEELFSISIPQVYVYRATWSPDGSQLLTAGLDDRTARIWDAQSGQELFSMTGLDQVAGSDWSAAGDMVAVGGQDGVVHVWDTVKGLEVASLFGTEPRIIKVTFSPDGERLLTVGDDNVVNVYDLSEALLRVNFFPSGPTSYMSTLVWSPDGKQVALGLEDGKARVWNATSGEQELLLVGHEDAIWYIAWSPSGDRIVTGSMDRTVRIWDSTTGIEQLAFTGHEDIPYVAEWSPDGSRIASNDLSSGKVIVWDSSTGEQILTFSTNHQGNVAPFWSPNGKHILSIGAYGEASIWDTVTGKVLLELFPKGFDLDIAGAAWTKDGKRVVLQSADGIVYTFDATSGKELSQFTMSRVSWSQMILSPTDQRILKGDDGGARVWDAEMGVELLRYTVLPGYNDAVYSPDGRQAVVASHLGTLKIFPAWHSVQELIDYAKECCVIRDLTAEEREQFGLPPR